MAISEKLSDLSLPFYQRWISPVRLFFLLPGILVPPRQHTHKHTCEICISIYKC